LIKYFALLLVVFTFILVAPVSAAEPDKGIIEGQVVNGTEGGSSVANQEIVLKTYLNDAEVDSTTTLTDAEGRFAFNELPTETDYGYEVTLTFQEAEYNSEWLTFEDSETSKFTLITVYDAIDSDEAIRVELVHTIIYVEPDSLRVEEYLLFINEASRTYIGSKNSTTGESRETLRFSLPKGATELQPTFGLMECCITGSKDGFVDTMPFLPGGKEVVYSYRVNQDSGTVTFSQRVNYPTANLELLVQGDSIKIDSDQLAAKESLNIEGIQFSHLSGKNLAPDDIVVAQLSGLPKTGNQGAIPRVFWALAAFGAGVAFASVYLRRKGRLQQVSSRDSLDQRRKRLLVDLAKLDDDFEDGKIPEDVYRKLRAARKAQLVKLMQRRKEENKTDNGET